DNAMVRLYIDSFKLDLESQLVRVEQDKKRADDGILLLYKFSDEHDERIEKLSKLLDVYQSKW
ncbi:MAG: hypothetical protein OQK13_01370, partial [Gammaproteobacteria bacterium]|nr:hypothetical protein [Gammaproteobacteria bacterium]